MRERDLRAGKAEGVQVRQADQLAATVGDAADVRDQARRLQLGGKPAEVAIEGGQRRGAVDERLLGPDRVRLPRRHPEASQIKERLHHARAIRLAHEAAVRLEQNMPKRDRLTEVRKHATHPAIVP